MTTLIHPAPEQHLFQDHGPPEAFVAWLWESGHVPRALHTTEGHKVQVIYPGRRFGSWGPDFHDALIAIDECVRHGDVEIHVRASDWKRHGHDLDAAYRETVLHVVYEETNSISCWRLGGVELPTVALSSQLGTSAEGLYRLWRSAPQPRAIEACLSPEQVGVVLDRAGMERFSDKVARFEADFTCVTADQALWAALLESLGYAANRDPMRRLADRVTFLEARELAAADLDTWHATLFGEAGLLPSQQESAQNAPIAPDSYADALESLWRVSGRRGPVSGSGLGGVGGLGWKRIGCRPVNSPHRRVAGVASLLSGRPALGADVLAVILTGELRRVPSALRQLIAHNGTEYWMTHSQFRQPLGSRAAVIGAQRAADIVVNVVLPWAAAIGRASGQSKLETAAAETFSAHPRLASNQLTRHMGRQVCGAAERQSVTTACRQQGLIQIYRAWCHVRECSQCLAGPGPHR